MKHLLIPEKKTFKQLLEFFLQHKIIVAISAAILVLLIITIILLCVPKKPENIKINQINDNIDCSNIFDDIYSIELVKESTKNYYENEETKKEVLKILNSVFLKPTPFMEKFKTKDYNGFNLILNDGFNINFNKDFSKFWISKNEKIGFLYEVVNPENALELEYLFEELIPDFIIAKSEDEENTEIKLKFKSVSIRSINPFFLIEIINNSKKPIEFTENFKLFTNGTECKGGSVINNPTTISVETGKSITQMFNLMGYDFSNPGMYKFSLDYNFKGETKKYTTSIELLIGEMDLVAEQKFTVTKTIFHSMTENFVPGDSIKYAISNRNSLLILNSDLQFSDTWNEVGKLEKFQLDQKNFDNIFDIRPYWAQGFTAEKIRTENKEALYAVSDDGNTIYFLLTQNDGKKYLAECLYRYGDYKDTFVKFLYEIKEYK